MTLDSADGTLGTALFFMAILLTMTYSIGSYRGYMKGTAMLRDEHRALREKAGGDCSQATDGVHLWSPWSDPRPHEVLESGRRVSTPNVQTRACTLCNKTEGRETELSS